MKRVIGDGPGSPEYCARFSLQGHSSGILLVSKALRVIIGEPNINDRTGSREPNQIDQPCQNSKVYSDFFKPVFQVRGVLICCMGPVDWLVLRTAGAASSTPGDDLHR